MTRAARAALLRQGEAGKAAGDAARDHQEAADEPFAKPQRLVDEIGDIQNGRSRVGPTVARTAAH